MRGSPIMRSVRPYFFGIIPAHAGLTFYCYNAKAPPRDHPRACGAHQIRVAERDAFKGSSPRMRGSLHMFSFPLKQKGIIPAHAGLTARLLASGDPCRDHPRACGAHVERPALMQRPSGSSPRMRGSLGSRAVMRAERGIIPAHAGLTNVERHCGRRYGDHPRACGAHIHNGDARLDVVGSSPRMRGSRPSAGIRNPQTGIIPAHAGLTDLQRMRAASERDHPRACGAHQVKIITEEIMLGSSPRMRGSRKVKIIVIKNDGIIPAHAGLTAGALTSESTSRDHPRACGAHQNPYNQTDCLPGSSPRMRGSQGPQAARHRHDGIIPAHAGLTTGDRPTVTRARDHPRACGAHNPVPANGRVGGGSSPRMRGSRFRYGFETIHFGIIPAHAGLTRFSRKVNQCFRDHPRACGAHKPKTIKGKEKMGSSPRMRGSLSRKVRFENSFGIIPAHAGLTNFRKPSLFW